MKRKKDAENAITNWETRTTGTFAPLWKPMKADDAIEVIPLSARYTPKRGKFQEGAFVTCKLVGGNSSMFFMKDVKRPVKKGGTHRLISILELKPSRRASSTKLTSPRPFGEISANVITVRAEVARNTNVIGCQTSL